MIVANWHLITSLNGERTATSRMNLTRASCSLLLIISLLESFCIALSQGRETRWYQGSGYGRIPLILRGGGNSVATPSGSTSSNREIKTLLEALRSDDEQGMRNLFKSHPNVLEAEDTWKQTALHIAAKEGEVSYSCLQCQGSEVTFSLQVDIVEKLVKLGSNLEHKNYLGRTPLLLAALSRRADVVELLVKHGADVNATDVNIWHKNSKRSALHWACHRGWQEMAAKLCELGADKEARDGLGRTPIHWAVRRGHLECLQVTMSRRLKWARTGNGEAWGREGGREQEGMG
eukprot:767188-Hanusia_phi.AAC.7